MPLDSELTSDFRQFDPSVGASDPQQDFQIVALADAFPLLEEVIQSGTDSSQDQVVEFATLLWQIAGKIENAEFNERDPELLNELSDAVIEGTNLIRGVFAGQPDALLQLETSHEQILVRFGNDIADDIQSDGANAWLDDADQTPEAGSLAEPDLPSAAAIESLLHQLKCEQSAGEVLPASKPCDDRRAEVSQQQDARRESRPPSSAANASPPTPTGATQLAAEDHEEIEGEHVDAELRCAFMDDAMRCLASMESSLLSLESNPADPNSLQTLGRELHTLKGASASIGLARLANYIHSVEDAIGEIGKSDQPAPLDSLLKYVDTIREKVNTFRDGKSRQDASSTSAQFANENQPATAANPTSSASPLNFDDEAGDDESVRVKASRLNRLMDMLSELVMSRNKRDSELAHLISIHEALLDSVSRLRALNQDFEPLRPSHESATPNNLLLGAEPEALLGDIANDVLESAQGLRECFQSVADGNNHVSQFIRGFRQELVELRRTPINGLFNRLRRAVSDAARSENKQVQLKLVGEETGIERAIQSRLFEPLLHIVRNSVSHGMESPELRAGAGKQEQGTITLQAKSGPDLLVIEVCDDGRGLDYEAIRRRGIQRGLITPDTSSHKELAQLIFHPSFSTRETASQISGRGVGMDVVASTLERMRGWVEVDSSAGQGTMIRLSIPLHSMIQHVMVFRSSGQLFAVPMQAVQSAGDEDEKIHAVCLDQLLDLNPTSENSAQEMIVLGNPLSTDKDHEQPGNIAILVDQIIGPEEVVVRPMPKLFRQHPICAGATLSGLGEVVLLLDSNRLSQSAGFANSKIPGKPIAASAKLKILVVDDSAAARMRVVQSLGRYPVQIVQSDNGHDAWQTFQTASFDVVFSDIEMPRMTGLQLLAEIKKHPTGRHTPVVLVSSRTEDSIRREAIQLGAAACLEKPLTNAAMDSVWPKVTLANPQTLDG